jgi:hypothetical protein
MVRKSASATTCSSASSERLAVELDALPLRALPPALLERRVRLGHVAGLRQDEGHRVLGRRHDVGLWRVDDHDPAPRGGLEVDVVQADAGPPHDQQDVGGFQHLGRHLRG